MLCSRSASIRKIDRPELQGTDSEMENPDERPGRKDTMRGTTKADRDRSIEIETLKLDIRLKDADSRYLQDLLHKKDDMLQQLTKGLSELEKSQQQWADDLYNAKVTIDELFDENQELMKENESLKSKLKIKLRSNSF